MPLTTGSYRIGPDDGSLLIRTGREGAAARMGHDLTLEATRWTATVTVNVEQPLRSKVVATVDAASLEVREASGGPVGLSDGQRAEIEETVRTKVLLSHRHPRITFRSTAVHVEGRRTSVIGALTIRRHTRPATLALRVATARTPRIVAATAVVQTEFGIAPYSALLGALRVKDVVGVTIDVRLPSR
jgi:polyisoprenoid-binding protein YceI